LALRNALFLREPSFAFCQAPIPPHWKTGKLLLFSDFHKHVSDFHVLMFDSGLLDAYNVDIMAELLGAFEQAVLLTVWSLGEGAYGRAVLRGVQSALNRQIAAGAVYSTLDRLEQKSLIDSQVEGGTPMRAGRLRRYYRLTAAGIKAMNESKTTLEQMWRGATWPLESKA